MSAILVDHEFAIYLVGCDDTLRRTFTSNCDLCSEHWSENDGTDKKSFTLEIRNIQCSQTRVNPRAGNIQAPSKAIQ